jgi:hypothetical protein
MNRLKVDRDISYVTLTKAIDLPQKNGIWAAPEDLKSIDDNSDILAKPNNELKLIRININSVAVQHRTEAAFPVYQLSVVCTDSQGQHKYNSNSQVIYPKGFMVYDNKGKTLSPNDMFEFDTASSEFKNGYYSIDFIFEIPRGMKPVLVRFKQNNVMELSAEARDEQIPEIIPFTMLAGDKEEKQEEVKEEEKTEATE